MNSTPSVKGTVGIEFSSLRRIHDLLETGTLSSVELVLHYLTVIDKYNDHLHALIDINHRAVSHAAYCDRVRRAQNKLPPLLGIPIIVSNDITTMNELTATFGSFALHNSHVRKEADLINRLKRAGAIILAQANVSEWGNIRDRDGLIGWSARGGLINLPSSNAEPLRRVGSGAAVAVAVGMAPAAVAVEPSGLVRMAAEATGLVAFKPGLGKVSAHGIIPISPSFDTPCFITRTVADGAFLYKILTDSTENFSLTSQQIARHRRIGYVDPLTSTFFTEKSLNNFTAIEVVDGSDSRYNDLYRRAILYEFGPAISRYLQEYTDSPLHSLNDIITFNLLHSDQELSIFGQNLFHYAAALMTDDHSMQLEQLIDQCHIASRRYLLDFPLSQHRLEALIACPSDSSAAVFAGYPQITIPLTSASKSNAAITVSGTRGSEAVVCNIAARIEAV